MKIKSFKEEFLRHGAFIAVGILTVLSGFVLLPFRGETSSAATAFVPSETTLTVDTEDIVVNAKTDVNNLNTFFTASSNLEIITNNYSGYTLRIAAEQEEDHDKLLGENDAYLASISEVTTETDFKTISSFVGKFGYKPSKLNSDENTNYLPAPDSVGDVLDVTAVANSVKNTYEISLAARVDMSIVSGDYSNVYVYTVVANPVPYMISYDKNTEDAVSNLPETQVDDTTDEDMTLSSDVPVREHYTFTGWCDGTTTAIDNADTCDGDVYQPGDSFYLDHTTNNSTTLKAMWSLNRYEVTVNAGNGVSTLALEGWAGTGTGTLKKTFFVGDTVDLSTFTPAYKTAYSGAKYVQNDSEGTLSGTTYTVGDGAGDISISATTLDTPVCTMTDGAGKVYNRSDTTITATNNSDNYDTNTTDITYSFGYSTSSASNPLGNFSEAKASNAFKVDKDSHYGARYYGVKVVVTNKNDNTITANCTSGTGTGTGSTVANRATVSLVNARIDFDANGGTLSSANPVYVAFQGTTYYTARTNADTTTSLPTVTPPAGYTFAGWYTAATGGNKVVNSDGTLTGTAVSGWSNSDRQWVVTKTSNEANTNLLYVRYSIKTNLSLKISFNSTYVSKVEVKSGSASGTTVGTVSTSGNTVTGLTYNTAYYLVPTYTTGSTLNSWAKDSGAVGTLSSTSAANPTYTIGDGTNAVTLNGKRRQYKVNLNKNGGTNDPTASVNVTYYNTSLPSIATLPERVHAMSGFTLDSSATGATVTYSTAASSNCTSASDCKSTYTFNGWYKESGATTLVANTAEPPALQASVSGLTDSSKRWIATSEQTLYAGWIAESGAEKADVTLPTITKTGYTCKWTDGTNNYNSGAAITPSSALNLTGTCSVNAYTITVKAGNGIDTLALSGWTNTGTGTLTKKLSYGSTLDLSTFTPAYKTAYSGKKYAKNSGSGSLSGSNFTVGAGTAALTISATTLDTPVCTMKGGIGKVYNLSPTTITATDNSGNYDTNSTNITYSFGYSGTTTGTLGNFSTADTVNTFEVDKDSHYGWHYYGVKVVVTNKNDNTITANCTSGTGTGTGETIANRTTVALVNARINFDSHDGTLSGSNSVYVAYEGTTYYTERGNINTTTSLPTVTPPTGYTFAGWYTAATGGSKVINANGTLTGSAVANFTNTGKQWVISSVSDNTTANMLHAHYDIKTNLSLKITFNSSHVSKVEVKTGSASGTTVGTVSTSGNSVSGLTYGEAYYLVPTYKTGYKVSSWAKDSGAVGTLSSTSAANPTYTIGDGTNAVTLTATTKSYTVTLNKNGATNTPTASVNVRYLGTSLATITTMPERVYNVSITNNVGATVTYSTAASSNCTSASDCKSRYTFNGWYKEAAATNKIASDASTPVLQANTDYTDANGKWSVDAGKTLYAGWIAETGVDKAQVTLPTVTKTGHNCSWNTSADGTGTTYTSGGNITPSAALSLKAVCTANNYTITVKAGTGISKLTLSGWTNSGTATLTKSLTYGSTLDLSTFTPTYNTGYSGTSYTKTSGQGSISGSTFTVGAGTTTITINGVATTYDITYNLNGGSVSTANPTTYNVTTNAFTLNNPTKTGYTFKGWSGTDLTGNANTTVTVAKGSTGDRSYTANWTGNTYTVTLNKNGGTGGTNSVTATYGSAMPSATMPTWEGHTFVGYYDTSAATGGTQYYKADGTSARSWNKTSDTTLYARWTLNSYTITVKAGTGISKLTLSGWTNSGTATLTNSLDYGSALDLSTFTPTYNSGYSGVTYTLTSGAGSISSSTFTVGDGATTITINGVATTYNISYDLDGGSVSTANPTTYKVTTATFTLNNPTKTGYTFAGWTGSNGTTPQTSVSIAKGSTGNKSYTANWTKNQYELTVTFAGTGVSSVKVCTVSGDCSGTNLKGTVSSTGGKVSGLDYDTAYYLYPAYTSGHTLNSWAKTSTTGTLSSTSAANPTFTMGAGNGAVTITGKAASYTITVKAGTGISKLTLSGWTNSGTATLTKSLTYGSTLDLSTFTPTYNTGYSGTSYTKTSGQGSISGSTFTVGAGTTTITINGVATSYTISYSLGSGCTVASANPTSYTIETATFTLNNPTCTGYTFKGWSGTGLSGNQNTTVTISKGSTGNRSYTANWTGNTYTVTLNKNNGTGGSNSVTATYGSAMPSATMPTRTGYTFAGYYDTSAATGGTQYYKADGTSARSWNKTSNTTLYARWTANTYTIKYNGRLPADDPTAGGEMADTSCTYDQDCTLRANAFHRYQDAFNVWNCISGCSATNIKNGAKVRNLTATNGGTVTLQAQWVGNPSFSDTAIHNIRMTSGSALFDFTTSVGTSAGNNIKYTLKVGTQTITKICAAGTNNEPCEFTNIDVSSFLANNNHMFALFDIEVVDAVTGSGANHTYTSVYYSYFFYIKQMYCTFRSDCRMTHSEADGWRNQSNTMADIVKLLYSDTSEVIPAFNAMTSVDARCQALYKGVLGRSADSGGLATCKNNLNSGKSIAWVAAGLANSANEAQLIYQKYGLGTGTTTLP